jgi:hypothetical protein
MAGKLTGPAPLSARALLARILEQPNLVAAVQALPAPALGKLINHVGLEDAGEIVALATSEQIRHIFDDDLWRSPRPGQDEAFDADRFALWLEIMLEAGEAFAAQRLAELPEDLVTLALARQVLVINIEEMAVTMSNRRSDDDVLLEKALESCLCEEIGEYRIIARRHEGWDAILGVLLALDRDHHAYLARVLDRCCYAAAEYIEENGGLYDVLTSEEMLEADAAAEREDRRAEQGYISPSSAASFLALARTTELDEIVRARERDPITKAYFRELGPHASQVGTPAKGGAAAADAPDAREAVKLVELLLEAEVLPKAQARALLEAPRSGQGDKPEGLLTQALRRLAARAAGDHARRMAELAFLANVLAAGCSIAERAFRPAEAARAAVAVCNLGLEHLVEHKAGTVDAALASGADRLFRVGWRLLWQEAIMPAARRIEGLLVEARGQEPGRAETLGRAASALRSAVAAGQPWTARGRLGVVRELGEPWPALLALIDECPHLDGVLAESTGGRGPRTSGDIAFVSTSKQLRRVSRLLHGSNM